MAKSRKTEPENPSTAGYASVRYIVDDVNEAVRFYTRMLGFTVVMHPADEFAILQKEHLQLLLSKPSDKGGKDEYDRRHCSATGRLEPFRTAGR